MGKIALIDGDGIVYAAGALAETVTWSVLDRHFDYKSHANKYVAEHELDKEEIERIVTPQPLSHALNITRTTLDAILEATESPEFELYIGNDKKDNFRFNIYPEYKANRKGVVKPHHYAGIRNWMRKQGAEETRGYEPDDALSIRAQELTVKGEHYIMVSNDKDLLQIPGDHYDWKKHVFHTITPWEGALRLYKQVLEGDSVDNIKGAPGIGPAKANAALRGATTEEELLEATWNEYKRVYSGDEKKARKMMMLNVRLIQMLKVRP